ncbi:DUF6455 family protein [Shimia sp.]|uniref:DUF6455 family protein n=1 Tax=Shimia sp. TaxID=1954381 RepID=UPI0032991965
MGFARPLGDPAKHFWLTRSVARALGLSLSEAMAEGTLTAAGYADLVTRCRTCTRVQDCETWLSECGGSSDIAPECCMHKCMLETLASRH